MMVNPNMLLIILVVIMVVWLIKNETFSNGGDFDAHGAMDDCHYPISSGMTDLMPEPSLPAERPPSYPVQTYPPAPPNASQVAGSQVAPQVAALQVAPQVAAPQVAAPQVAVPQVAVPQGATQGAIPEVMLPLFATPQVSESREQRVNRSSDNDEDGHGYKLAYVNKWPRCDNHPILGCQTGSDVDYFKLRCSEHKDCDGFTWDKNDGCFKINCKKDTDDFLYGSSNYYQKTDVADTAPVENQTGEDEQESTHYMKYTVPRRVQSCHCNVPEHVPSEPHGEETADLLGCYREDPEANLPHKVFTNGDRNLTPKKCQYLCRNKGYRYAGVQFGNECWCGNGTKGLGEKRSDDECNIPCSGDPEQNCGGVLRQNIYQVGGHWRRNGCLRR